VEIFVENFNKVMNGFKVREVVVSNVDTDTEVKSGVATVDYLEIPKLCTYQNTIYTGTTEQ